MLWPRDEITIEITENYGVQITFDCADFNGDDLLSETEAAPLFNELTALLDRAIDRGQESEEEPEE